MNKRMVYVLFFLLHLASIFSIFVEKIIGSSSSGQWEAILFGLFIECIAVWLYVTSIAKYPGKTIMEICKETAGPWFSRLILLPLLLFLFFHLILLVNYQVVQIKSVLLPQTPFSVILFIFVYLFVYGSWKGLPTILRGSMMLVLLVVPFVLFSLLISVGNFQFRYVFPIWDGQASFIAKPDYYVSFLAFSGFLFLGMVASKQAIKFRQFWLVMVLIGLFSLASVYVPLVIFGWETAQALQYPVMMASDTVDLEWVVFDWLPTFFVVSTSGLNILLAAVLFWMSTTLIRQLFLPIGEKWIKWGLSPVVFFLSMWVPNMRALNEMLSINTFFCLYSIVGVPVILSALTGFNHKRRAVS